MTAADGKTFSYDSQNELITMNGGVVQVLYDGDGHRVAEAVTSGGVTTTTHYLVDDLNPTGLPQVVDELTNGVVTRTYTYGLQRISEDQFISGAWTPSFYSYDGMGSVRQLTNVSGAVTASYEFDAFGNEVTHTGTTPNNYLYRGEQWDSDVSLYYLRARYYNPLTGRFLSRDPGDGDVTDPSTLHKYLYADADPVNGSDPTGWMDGAAGTMPGTRAGVGSAIGEYAVIVLQALSASVAVADVGCAVSTAYYVLAADLRFDTNITTGKCEARGEGRMRVQLQLGLGNGKSLTPWGMAARNQDPPGVTLSQVGGLLTALWGAANSGTIPRFPKSENYDLYNAIIAASLCAKSHVPGGTWGLDKTICSEPVGNSGWRVDVDQLNGRNLTQ